MWVLGCRLCSSTNAIVGVLYWALMITTLQVSGQRWPVGMGMWGIGIGFTIPYVVEDAWATQPSVFVCGTWDLGICKKEGRWWWHWRHVNVLSERIPAFRLLLGCRLMHLCSPGRTDKENIHYFMEHVHLLLHPDVSCSQLLYLGLIRLVVDRGVTCSSCGTQEG